MVADGHGQRVGRINGRRRLPEAQQQSNHLLHLPLARLTVAGDGLLDLQGRVLVYLDRFFGQGQQGTPRACPSRKALWTFLAKNTASTAAQSGRVRLKSVRSSWWMRSRR